VIITDSSYVKLTEVYPPEPQGDEKWDVYLRGQELGLRSIQTIFEYDAINQMKDDYRPILMDSGYFADSPRLTAPVVRDHALVGYVSALVGARKCGEEELAAIAIVADAVAMYLQTQRGEQYNRVSLRHFFARSLIQGEIKEAGELKKWLALLDLRLSPRYALLALAPTRSDRENFGYYLQDQIEKSGLPLLMAPSGRFIYVLLYGTRNHAHSQSILGELEQMMGRFHFSCGVSRSFARLEDIEGYRQQAEIAFDTGRAWRPGETAHHYRDLTLQAMMDAAAEKLGRENCCHPALDLLAAYDKENNSEYWETLKAYVLSPFSSQETCKALHIHRNTLGYRLGRIEELTGIRLEDLNTRIHLVLSFLMSPPE
jgi:sugar diacid utilization regulator